LLESESLLLEKGLKISKIIPVHSSTVEKDRIIAQKPEPHEQISDYITVLVSLGPYDDVYFCPDFRDMYLDRAKALASQLNLTVSVHGTGDKIEAQKPGPYSEIKSGDTVYLKVYEYEEIPPEGVPPDIKAPPLES
jgi:beta-lactam-binding protein with PASTA domain